MLGLPEIARCSRRFMLPQRAGSLGRPTHKNRQISTRTSGIRGCGGGLVAVTALAAGRIHFGDDVEVGLSGADGSVCERRCQRRIDQFVGPTGDSATEDIDAERRSSDQLRKLKLHPERESIDSLRPSTQVVFLTVCFSAGQGVKSLTSPFGWGTIAATSGARAYS
jgi:hypothetical protein